MGEKQQAILICFVSYSCFLFHALQVHVWFEKLHNWYKWQIGGGKKRIMQNRQLEQISLWLKMAIIRQKTDFCLQETLSASQPKQHKIQGKHSIIFPPLFGNMEKENLAMIFFFLQFYQKWHFFFFFNPALTNDGVWFLVLGTDDRPSKEKRLDGRQSAGNCKAAKKTEAPSTGCLHNISLFEYDENIICLIDHQLPK